MGDPHLLPMPPLGLVPRFIREERRLHEIDSAIARYVAALMPIPYEWSIERNDLLFSMALRPASD